MLGVTNNPVSYSSRRFQKKNFTNCFRCTGMPSDLIRFHYTILTGDYRLVGGKAYGSGRAEIKPESSQPWGTVCDHSYATDGAACWLCIRNGFNFCTSTKYVTETHLPVLNESTPISIKGLNCPCSTDDCSAFGTSTCGHDEDIYVYCQ